MENDCPRRDIGRSNDLEGENYVFLEVGTLVALPLRLSPSRSPPQDPYCPSSVTSLARACVCASLSLFSFVISSHVRDNGEGQREDYQSPSVFNRWSSTPKWKVWRGGNGILHLETSGGGVARSQCQSAQGLQQEHFSPLSCLVVNVFKFLINFNPVYLHFHFNSYIM